MFAKKTVIVTGGAGAVGREVVRWFNDRGAQVGVLDVNDAVLESAFPTVADSLYLVSCNLTQRDSCAEAVAKIQERFEQIDILCNVAGGFLMGDPVHETSNATWDFLLILTPVLFLI